MMNKKAMEMYTLVSLLITILGFFAMLYVVGTSNYSIEEELQMTRASLFMAEKYEANSMDTEVFRFDLYLRTHFLDVPEQRYTSSKESVIKNFADRIADCWWEFGEGKISDDVLGKNNGVFSTSNKCFTCFILNVKKLDKEFTFKELIEYMLSHPYKAKAKKFKYCDTNGNPPGCVSTDTSECVAKGGACVDYNSAIASKKTPSDICKANGLFPYKDWKCEKSKELCCVSRNQLMTYMEYIHSGNGVIYMPFDFLPQSYKDLESEYNLDYKLTDRSIIKPGYDYAISFKDLTKSNLGTWGGAIISINLVGSIGAQVGTGICVATGVGVAILPICSAVGYVVGGVIGGLGSLVQAIIDTGKTLQGVMITPYPSDKWGSCDMQKES